MHINLLYIKLSVRGGFEAAFFSCHLFPATAVYPDVHASPSRQPDHASGGGSPLWLPLAAAAARCRPARRLRQRLAADPDGGGLVLAAVGPLRMGSAGILWVWLGAGCGIFSLNSKMKRIE